MNLELSAAQKAAIQATNSTLLYGTAGSGKSTALQLRLKALLDSGEPAYTILILIVEGPQRNRFLDYLNDAGHYSLADLKVTNYVGLAREMVSIFWPLVARQAGFAHAFTSPTWLSYDLAQLLMWEVVTPLLTQGHFADLRLRPQQIVSQLLDNLNRAALNGLEISAAIQKQIDSWSGEADHIRHLRDAERAATQFRQTCYENNLLDLSLVTDVFNRHVVNHPEFSRYFSERFRHLIVDNVEEQTAAGQHFVAKLLNSTVSTTIALDEGGGYKRFLAADPQLAIRFRSLCQQEILFEERYIDRQGVYTLANHVTHYLQRNDDDIEQLANQSTGAQQTIVGVVTGRYRREMLVRLGPALRQLMREQSIEPRDIAIIVPYMDGALRYKLGQTLQENNLPYQLARRRASPREEPRVRAWLTWLTIAHPNWQVMPPSLYDVSEALSLSLSGLDPARAALLANSLYQPAGPSFRPTSELTEDQVQRIGPYHVERFAQLLTWLEENGHTSQNQLPIDFFIHNLFSQMLSSRAFSPEPDSQAAAICDWLIRLATRVRESARALRLTSSEEIGRAFVDGIRNGLVTAHPPDMGAPPDPNGIFISTIYGYLLSEKSVAVQVWLETAATGWWDIPRQPLSNAFVLSSGWEDSAIWTMEDDVRIRNELLSRIITGLTSRCSQGVLLATSDLDRRGVRQDGPLWRALETLQPKSSD